MKKIVRITGLDCPNCAMHLQNQFNKIEGVKNCEIDFTHSKLTFESENIECSLAQIIELTSNLEPDAKIEEIEKKSKKTQKKFIFDVIFIIFGVITAYFCCKNKLVKNNIILCKCIVAGL